MSTDEDTGRPARRYSPGDTIPRIEEQYDGRGLFHLRIIGTRATSDEAEAKRLVQQLALAIHANVAGYAPAPAERPHPPPRETMTPRDIAEEGPADGFDPPTWEFVDELRDALHRIADDAPEHLSGIARRALEKRPAAERPQDAPRSAEPPRGYEVILGTGGWWSVRLPNGTVHQRIFPSRERAVGGAEMHECEYDPSCWGPASQLAARAERAEAALNRGDAPRSEPAAGGAAALSFAAYEKCTGLPLALRRLLDALGRYGEHDEDCALAQVPADIHTPCTCGLHAAERSIDEAIVATNVPSNHREGDH